MPVNGSDPAYPVPFPCNATGMDIRTKVTAMAMQSLLVGWYINNPESQGVGLEARDLNNPDDLSEAYCIAQQSYIMADALIAELNKPREPEPAKPEARAS